MTGTEEKRREFLEGGSRYRGPNRIVFLVFALVAVIGVGIFALGTRNTAAVSSRWQGGTYNVGRTMDYKDQVISMTDISLGKDGNQYTLKLKDIIDKKIIYAETDVEYRGKLKAVTSFVSPAGRLVVAIAMCEPCRSQRFRIEGNILVCETCGTRWQLSDLQGLSGGCPQYAPEEIPYEVNGDTISFDTAIIKEWEPRVVR